MSVQNLIDEIPRLARVDDGPHQLRRFVLDLAVRGKLVPQVSSEQPACDLLQAILDDREKSSPRNGIATSLGTNEVPFPLPSSWLWVRTRHILHAREQIVPSVDFTYLDVGSINKERGRIEAARVLSAAEAPSRARKVVRRGDVIYSCVRPYLLNIAVIEEEFVPAAIASTAFAVLDGRGYVLPRYQWIVLRSSYFIKGVETKMRGQAYPAINDAEFAAMPFPLPPIAEQQRIVDKVGELLKLCDDVESANTDVESARNAVCMSVYKALDDDSDDDVNYIRKVERALKSVKALSSRAKQMPAFRRAIRGLAVRGKLTRREPNDGSALELLHEIHTERRQPHQICTLTKARATDVVRQSSRMPFRLPSTWAWARFSEVAIVESCLVDPRRFADLPHIAPDNIEAGTGHLLPFSTVGEAGVISPKHLFKAGQLLYSKIRPALAKVVCVDFEGLCSADMYPICPLIDRSYLHEVMLSDMFINQSIAEANRVAMPKINQQALAKIAVPVPPLDEQRRIVSVLGQMMDMCDDMEVALRSADVLGSTVLNAAIREALPFESRPETFWHDGAVLVGSA